MDRTGNDLAGNLVYTQNGGKYAGGTTSGSSFAASRAPSADVPQLSFFRNRIYDQKTGRWTQEDPIGVAGGVNLYQFNGNNPVAYTDPFGLCPPCSDREDGFGDNDPGFADPTAYIGPAEVKLGAALLVGIVSDASKVAFEGAIGRIFTGLAERFGAAVEKLAATGARQAEFTVAKDGTKVILRGPETHSLPGSGGKPVTHYNVEVQKPTGKPGRFKKVEDTHLDADGRVLDP
ncbi:MAG: RHS repeat-associated core domain-containing protein [Geodermatophilaceae bacterium]|nr:RHS repeat-associated core domain-containing protein [Geodermatophilaceae bacterium]